jgi:hypothetical protein
LDVTVWPAGEFAAINTARIVGKADHEIRNLIARSEAAQIIAVLQREEARRPGFIAIHTVEAGGRSWFSNKTYLRSWTPRRS